MADRCTREAPPRTSLSCSAAAAAYAAWCIIAERRATTQIVRTVEAIKGHVPEFKAVANGIQTSKITRRIVDTIKGTA